MPDGIAQIRNGHFAVTGADFSVNHSPRFFKSAVWCAPSAAALAQSNGGSYPLIHSLLILSNALMRSYYLISRISSLLLYSHMLLSDALARCCFHMLHCPLLRCFRTYCGCLSFRHLPSDYLLQCPCERLQCPCERFLCAIGLFVHKEYYVA